MKKLEELGISPWPWEYEGDSENTNSFDVICHLASGIRYQVAAPYIHMSGMTDENARLIAAAPELYECLREAVVEMCHGHACCGEEYECNGLDGRCFVMRWRAALAKAAGEEVAK